MSEITFTCGVCGESNTKDDADDTFHSVAGGGRPPDLICDRCFEAIRAGVCGVERQGYACLRPAGHTAGAHFSIDGKYGVSWTDDRTGVTLRRRRGM